MRRFVLILTGWIALASAAAAQDITGQYTMQGNQPGGSSYTGVTEIVATGQTYQIDQDNGTLTGVGLLVGNQFSVAVSDGIDTYLGVYEVMEDGTLQGIWTVEGEDRVGIETLTPVDGGSGGGTGGGPGREK